MQQCPSAAIQPSWLVISCILFSPFEKRTDPSDALITRPGGCSAQSPAGQLPAEPWGQHQHQHCPRGHGTGWAMAAGSHGARPQQPPLESFPCLQAGCSQLLEPPVQPLGAPRPRCAPCSCSPSHGCALPPCAFPNFTFYCLFLASWMSLKGKLRLHGEKIEKTRS